MVMAPVLDFWFDFASTYSYPAAMRIAPLAREAGITVRFRPFLLGPVFKAQGWDTSPFNLYPAKGRNMWRDLERLCGDLNIPFRRPAPFPQNSLLAARIALVGLNTTWGEEFCQAVHATFQAFGRLLIFNELALEAETVEDRREAGHAEPADWLLRRPPWNNSRVANPHIRQAARH